MRERERLKRIDVIKNADFDWTAYRRKDRGLLITETSLRLIDERYA